MVNVLLVGLNRSWIRALDSMGSTFMWVYEEPGTWDEKAHWLDGVECFRGERKGDLKTSDVGEDVVAWAADIGVDVVLPGVDYAVQLATFVAERLGLAGLGVAAAELLTNKVALRQACQWAGIAQPVWRVIEDVASHSPHKEQFPLVMKPSNLQASAGVSLIRSLEEWQKAVTRLQEALESAGERSVRAQVLLEELMDGPEYSTEVLVSKGVRRWMNVTRKHIVSGIAPVETGHDVPGVYSQRSLAAFERAVDSLVEAVGVKDGLLHAEWIAINDELHLVESAGRAPGDYILHLVEDAWGLNVYKACIEMFRTGSFGAPEAPRRGAVIRYLVKDPGTVLRAEAETAARLQGVQALDLFKSKGGVVGELTSSWDRCGYVRTVGSNVDEAERIAVIALGAIDFVVRPSIAH